MFIKSKFDMNMNRIMFERTYSVMFLLWVLFLTLPACEDIDTGACMAMMSKDLNLCSDFHLANSACPRSCGLCPPVCYNCWATAANVSDCHTAPCGTDEMCLLKTKPLPDGNGIGYTMGCGPRSICSKRAIEGIEREDRDIFIRCCEGDRCNYPVITTTQPTTVKQRGCIKDFIIMLEDSSSLAMYYPIIKVAIKNVLNFIDLDTDGTRVAMGTFHGSTCATRWDLDQYTNKTELIVAIDRVTPHPDGSTDGFNTVAVECLVDGFKQGNRPDVPDVILLNSQVSMDMSDSNFNLIHGHSQGEAINLLHQRSNNVIVIAYGNADVQEMESIASDSQHYMYIKSIVDMDTGGFQQRLGALISLMCSA